MKAKLRKISCLLGETLMCSLAGARTHAGRHGVLPVPNHGLRLQGQGKGATKGVISVNPCCNIGSLKH